MRILVFENSPPTYYSAPAGDSRHVASYLMLRDVRGKWEESWYVMTVEEGENPLYGLEKILETIDG